METQKVTPESAKVWLGRTVILRYALNGGVTTYRGLVRAVTTTTLELEDVWTRTTERNAAWKRALTVGGPMDVALDRILSIAEASVAETQTSPFAQILPVGQVGVLNFETRTYKGIVEAYMGGGVWLTKAYVCGRLQSNSCVDCIDVDKRLWVNLDGLLYVEIDSEEPEP